MNRSKSQGLHPSKTPPERQGPATRFIDRLAEYSDTAVLEELKRVANSARKTTLTMNDLKHARLSYGLLKKRFGGLRKALVLAGLSSQSFNRNVTDEDLLKELERVWDLVLQNEGRRPFKEDLVKYHAKYSQGPYYRRWGSWIRACEALLERSDHSAQAGAEAASIGLCPESGSRRTFQKRSIPLRLRYEVLQRDGFTCSICGRSPASCRGLKLHVDHIKPESKGGPTERGNLRTLCEDCNLGKGALEERHEIER
jgi:hypothetical protein